MPYFVPPPMSEEVEQKETILPEGGVIQEVISPKYFIVLSTTLM